MGHFTISTNYLVVCVELTQPIDYALLTYDYEGHYAGWVASYSYSVSGTNVYFYFDLSTVSYSNFEISGIELPVTSSTNVRIVGIYGFRTDTKPLKFSGSLTEWVSTSGSTNKVTISNSSDLPYEFRYHSGGDFSNYLLDATFVDNSLGYVRIAIATQSADVKSFSASVPILNEYSVIYDDGISNWYVYIYDFATFEQFSFSVSGGVLDNNDSTPMFAMKCWTSISLDVTFQRAWYQKFFDVLDNMGGQLSNIWSLVNTRFSDLSGWISAQTDTLVATLNGWLESIDTQIYTFRSMVNGWFSDLWDSLEGIRKAIIGESSDLSNSQDYEDTAASQATEASGLVGELDDVTKPPSDEVNTDIDDYVSADGMEMYGEMLNPILSNQYILNILVLSLTLMIGSYILFGKR